MIADRYAKNIIQIFLLLVASICFLGLVLSSEPDKSSSEHVEVVCECSCACSCVPAGRKAHERIEFDFEEV